MRTKWEIQQRDRKYKNIKTTKNFRTQEYNDWMDEFNRTLQQHMSKQKNQWTLRKIV